MIVAVSTILIFLNFGCFWPTSKKMSSKVKTIHRTSRFYTQNSFKRCWPCPFIFKFIVSLFQGVGADLLGLLMCRPSSLQLGTPAPKRCKISFLEIRRIFIIRLVQDRCNEFDIVARKFNQFILLCVANAVQCYLNKHNPFFFTRHCYLNEEPHSFGVSIELTYFNRFLGIVVIGMISTGKREGKLLNIPPLYYLRKLLSFADYN